MTQDTFWSIIEDARMSTDDCYEIAAAVKERLRSMPPEEIIDFSRHIEQRLEESYRNDLWAIAYILNGGCSDDGFEYFRGWLIVQGRDYYEAAIA